MFQPTWPSSGETHYLRDTWQEISYIKYVSFYKNVKMLIPPTPKYFMHRCITRRRQSWPKLFCKTH